MGEEIDRIKRERAQKSSRTTSQDLQAQLETKRQDAINSIREASLVELEGGNESPFSTNYGNKYIAGISREDVELKVNSANALELEELGFGPPPTTGMTITEEVSLFGETSSSEDTLQGESSTSSASQEPPVRRIPKSKKTKTVLDIGITNVTKSEIESKIQENKDHHKDNCNGIIP